MIFACAIAPGRRTIPYDVEPQLQAKILPTADDLCDRYR